jgi:hypothetical protein
MLTLWDQRTAAERVTGVAGRAGTDGVVVHCCTPEYVAKELTIFVTQDPAAATGDDNDIIFFNHGTVKD